MLEQTNFSLPDIPKKLFKEEYKPLVERLVVLQQQARNKGIGLVVLFEGYTRSGRGSAISNLMYNLDARATQTFSITQDDPNKQIESLSLSELNVTGEYPALKPYWDALQERGCITFFNSGWYLAAGKNGVFNTAREELFLGSKNIQHKKIWAKSVGNSIDSIEAFERQLTNDGYIVVKFFMNIRMKTQAKRIFDLFSNPETRWRISDESLAEVAKYDIYKFGYDYMLERSNFDFAPWTVLNGENTHETMLAIAKTLTAALEGALVNGIISEGIVPPATAAKAPEKSAFDIEKHHPSLKKVDYSLEIERDEYKKELKFLQKHFSELQEKLYRNNIPMIIMYEGWDAAGKGGNIKRLAQALDARAYTIFPSPAPTKPELMHPFLWRYWTRLPKAGHIGIYDRSWYGRVLVERVEGFAKPHEWSRAYDEINEFEHDLIKWGAIVVKFWVEIDQDEQLNRFEARQNTPEKQWKITDEDWRNREKYPQYYEAVEDMFRLTSTKECPWTILESNNKMYARLKALRTVIAAMEKRLEE